MILSTLQTAGLLVGISYYIMTLRNQQKSQKHAEETRKIQLMLEITQYIQSGNQADWQDLLNLEWTDFNDFQSKYGFENNPTIYSKRLGTWRNLSVSGLLIRDGLLDISTYADYIGNVAPQMWNKYQPIIEEMRRVYDTPDLYYGIEYVAKENDKYRVSKGLEPIRI